MRSTLKVAYQDRFGHPKGTKEPVIRIELVKTDDPRDTMLEDLVDLNSELGIMSLGYEPTAMVGASPTFLIYKKSISEQAGEIMFDVFQTLNLEHGDRFKTVYHSGVYYFELNKSSEYRSKGVRLEDYYFNFTVDFKTALINDFKDFYEKYLRNMDFETFQKTLNKPEMDKITNPDAAGYHTTFEKVSGK